jgi:hypothetical protein
MSNAALANPPYRYDRLSTISPAARRILRRAITGCCPSRKKTYRTARKARIALAAIQRDELRRQTALEQSGRVERKPYACEHCGPYHLTSRA